MPATLITMPDQVRKAYGFIVTDITTISTASITAAIDTVATPWFIAVLPSVSIVGLLLGLFAGSGAARAAMLPSHPLPRYRVLINMT